MSAVVDAGTTRTARYLRAIPNTDVPKEDIETLCRRWNVTELSAYGLLLDNGFDLDIELCIVVRYAPGTMRSLLRSARLQNELEDMFGFRPNLSSPEAIEQDTNSIRTEAIHDGLEKFYEA